MFKLFPPGFPIWKRLFDLILTIPGSILVSPIFGLIAISIFLVDGPPIFFKQKRPGYKGKVFTLYKFRTMKNSYDQQGKPLPDGQRISRLGRILRKTSLDELPEIINVLRGEMSLVGPRPLLIAYLELYSPEQARRHDTPPGITGWAQIHGRNALDWDQRFKHDVWYVDHRSLWLDIKILLTTFLKVVQMEGISQPGHATVQEFMGNQQNPEKN